MFNKKQIIVVVVLAIVLLTILFSWNFMKEKPKPIIAKPLDVSGAVTIQGDSHESDDLLTVNYSWKTGAQWTTPTVPLHVFVHLQDEDGERLCQDDHIPIIPISQWEPNQTYSYERTFYIPITLLKKKVFLLAGIYNRDNTGEYYAIQGLKQFNPYHRYLAGEFVLNPSDREYSEALIKYTRGWYDPEVDKRGNVMWRWMKERGEAQIVNPKADAVLFIDAWIPNDHFTEPAVITISLAGKPLELPTPEQNYIKIMVNLPAAELGEENYIPLVIETDKTFVPAREGNSVDARELGVMVKKILFRAQ